MATKDDEVDYNSFLERKYRNEREREQRDMVQYAVEEGNKAVAERNYSLLLEDVGFLRQYLDLDPIYLELMEEKAEENDLTFDRQDVERIRDDFDELWSKIKNRTDPPTDWWSLENPNIFSLVMGFKSLVTITQLDKNENSPISLGRTSDLYGKYSKIGQLYETWEDDWGDRVHAIDPEEPPKVTVVQGDKGNGKSATLDTMAIDRYRGSVDEATEDLDDRDKRGHKIIDILDLDTADNCLYDIPQTEDDLLELRREIGVAESIDEMPDCDPNIEIFHPLTPALDDIKVPYDTDSDEYTVQPFTFPVSELPIEMLLTLLGGSTSEQRNYIRTAYEQVSVDTDDWTIEDLADAIHDTEAGEKIANRLTNRLERLQNRGFIRDKQDDRCLDWERILFDQDTITVFTCCHMEQTTHKFMVLAYLTKRFSEVREELQKKRRLPEERERITEKLERHDVEYVVENGGVEIPTITVVVRETHLLTPTNKTVLDPPIKALQKTIRRNAASLFAIHRHYDTEFLLDTQAFTGQLYKRVRDMTNRIVSYQHHPPIIENLFDNFIGSNPPFDAQKYIYRIANEFDTGYCAVFGDHGYSEKPFVMPIQMAPPPILHLDTGRGLDYGWAIRAEYLDNEELRSHDWDTTVPGRLAFDAREIDDTVGDVSIFTQECLQPGEGSRVPKREVWWMWRAWSRRNDTDCQFQGMNAFLSALEEKSSYLDFDDDTRPGMARYGDKQIWCFSDVRFTELGLQLLEEWVETGIDEDIETPDRLPDRGV